MNPHAQEIPVIASQGRIGTAPDPGSVREHMAPVGPLDGRRQWHGHPTTRSRSCRVRRPNCPGGSSSRHVRCRDSGPSTSCRRDSSSVYVLSRAPETGDPHIGPMLCCPAHAQTHIPVEAGTAYQWHVPQTVCRAGRLWECALGSQVVGYSRCSTVWLLPPDGHPERTDSATLLHWFALTWSGGARNREDLHGG